MLRGFHVTGLPGGLYDQRRRFCHCCQARRAVAIVAGGGSLRNLALSKPSPNGVTGLALLSPRWGLVVIGYAFRALPDPARIEPTLRV